MYLLVNTAKRDYPIPSKPFETEEEAVQFAEEQIVRLQENNLDHIGTAVSFLGTMISPEEVDIIKNIDPRDLYEVIPFIKVQINNKTTYVKPNVSGGDKFYYAKEMANKIISEYIDTKVPVYKAQIDGNDIEKVSYISYINFNEAEQFIIDNFLSKSIPVVKQAVLWKAANTVLQEYKELKEGLDAFKQLLK